MLLIVEAGLEIDVPTLRQTGFRGFLTSISSAIFGTLPIGLGLAKAVGFETTAAIAVGICLCPSSSGVALTVRALTAAALSLVCRRLGTLRPVGRSSAAASSSST